MAPKATKTPMTVERDEILSTRVSLVEKEDVEKAAHAVGLSVSAFVRMAALERARAKKPSV